MLSNKAATSIIYLIGEPGVGKYTIAQEIAKHGYVVCDNQLVNNPIFTLLNYDGFTKIPKFAWDVIKKIRDNVFEFILQEPNNSYVFTNVLLDDEGDRNLFDQVEQMASERGSLFIPVKLLVREEEHIKRIQSPDRRLRYKSIDINDVTSKQELLNIVNHNLLELDITSLIAQEAADKILAYAMRVRG